MDASLNRHNDGYRISGGIYEFCRLLYVAIQVFCIFPVLSDGVLLSAVIGKEGRKPKNKNNPYSRRRPAFYFRCGIHHFKTGGYGLFVLCNYIQVNKQYNLGPADSYDYRSRFYYDGNSSDSKQKNSRRINDRTKHFADIPASRICA